MSRGDQNLARLLVEKGIVSRAAVERLMAEKRSQLARGRAVTLWDLVVERRIATPNQLRTWTSRGVKTEGRRVGDWEVGAELGRGTFGIVYEARHREAPDQIRAMKILRIPDEADRQRVTERFRREAQAMHRLNHPNIVHVYEYGSDGGLLFYVMDRVEGRVLSDLIPVNRPVHETRPLLRLLQQLLSAVQHAHDHGIVHRDLKLQNVLVDDRGVPHLTDFGLARTVHGRRVTKTGDLIGTPFYMSPEQAAGEGKKADHRTDIWAVGIMLHRVLTGTYPFLGETQGAILEAVVKASPDFPDSLTEAEKRVLRKALAKHPDDRYPSARAFAEDIQRLLDGESIAPPSRWAPLMRRARRRPVVAGGFLLILLGLGWVALKPDPAERSTIAPDERLRSLRRRAKAQLEADNPIAALQTLTEVERRLQDIPTTRAEDLRPIRLERARALASLGRAAEALDQVEMLDFDALGTAETLVVCDVFAATDRVEDGIELLEERLTGEEEAPVALRLRRAEMLHLAGQVERARSAFEALLSEPLASLETERRVHRGLTSCEIALGQAEKALRRLERLPGAPWRTLELARAARAYGVKEGLLKAIALLDGGEGGTEWILERARLRRRLGHPHAAWHLLQRSGDAGGSEARLLRAAALVDWLEQAGRQDGLPLDPDRLLNGFDGTAGQEARARAIRARCWSIMGWDERALAEAQRGVERDKTSVPARLTLVRMARNAGKRELAERAVLPIRETETGLVEKLRLPLQIDYTFYAARPEALDAALERFDHPSLHLFRGVVLDATIPEGKGRLKVRAAQTKALQGFERRGGRPFHLYRRGRLFRAMADNAIRRLRFERARNQAPAPRMASLNVARGDWLRRAEQNLRRALFYVPEYGPARLELALVLQLAAGETMPESRQALDRALRYVERPLLDERILDRLEGRRSVFGPGPAPSLEETRAELDRIQKLVTVLPRGPGEAAGRLRRAARETGFGPVREQLLQLAAYQDTKDAFRSVTGEAMLSGASTLYLLFSQSPPPRERIEEAKETLRMEGPADLLQRGLYDLVLAEQDRRSGGPVRVDLWRRVADMNRVLQEHPESTGALLLRSRFLHFLGTDFEREAEEGYRMVARLGGDELSFMPLFYQALLRNGGERYRELVRKLRARLKRFRLRDQRYMLAEGLQKWMAEDIPELGN